MKSVFGLVFLFCWLGGQSALAFGLSSAGERLPDTAAIAVSTVYLFPDTSLSAVSTTVLRGGTLLRVLGRSANEHLDKDQNQQFFWYWVEMLDGRRGWVFGDALAVMQAAGALPENLRPLQRRPVSLNDGFDDAMLWLAAVEGHDSKEYRSNFYGEYYFVVTNAAGRCAFLRYAGKSAQGETALRQLVFQDLTGDGKPEFALETSSLDLENNNPETRSLDIYDLQNGFFKNILSEKLTLTDSEDMPAPALFKFVDIEPKTVRFEYLEYLPCARYSLRHPPAPLGTSPEDCLEFVTYTLAWNARNRKFEPLYEPSRMAPTVTALNFGVSVREIPALAGNVVDLLTAEDKLTVIRQVDRVSVENGVKKVQPFLYVRTPKGEFGYVSGAKVSWQKLRHAPILEAYCKNAPLLRSLWRYDFAFVRWNGPGGPIGVK